MAVEQDYIDLIPKDLINYLIDRTQSIRNVTLLKGGGSDRKYFRLFLDSGDTSVLCLNQNGEENKAFVEMSRVLREKGIKAPEIYAFSDNREAYIMEDLDDTDLLSILKESNRYSFAKLLLEELVKIQTIEEINWAGKTFTGPFIGSQITRDLNYFKYCFLKPAGIEFDEDLMDNDFSKLVNEIESFDESALGLMYRDFQSRNIMIKNEEPYFIDFQGARKGPVIYDAISFLWQAKAGFSMEEREDLMDFYINRFAKQRNISPQILRKTLKPVLILRLLQVLGAYGFRGLIEKKSHFIESLKPALANIEKLLERGLFDEFQEIKKALILAVRKFKNEEVILEKDKLLLSVKSFSYKKGYPFDLTLHGGGFVFDCRGMNNPGRYEQLRNLTGRDKEVIDFLIKEGEAEKFVENCVALVKPVIENYIQRRFYYLSVAFGCTGGRHRSVYCADRFTEKMKELFPEIKIVLKHRERNF